MLNKRSEEKEWIDLGENYYTEQEYIHCLKQLNRIGRYLGGNRAGLKAFYTLKSPPKSILDIGCGGGGFTKKLARTFPTARVLGIDSNPKAIAFAKASAQLPNLAFACQSSDDMPLNTRYDIVTATLLCHHFDEIELTHFVQQAIALATEAVIINDLHRHPIPYCFFALASPIFFPNRLIAHDGLISIKKGFTKKEWENTLDQCHIDPKNRNIQWHFPFRHTVILQK